MTRRRRSGRQQRAMDRLDERQNAIFGDDEVGLMPQLKSPLEEIDPMIRQSNERSMVGFKRANLKRPPLPESGLPEGWSMEQWEHYGQQWLDSQVDNSKYKQEDIATWRTVFRHCWFYFFSHFRR